MKFKHKDRVVLVKNYSYYPNVGLRGTIIGIALPHNQAEQEYQVRWDAVHTEDDELIFEGELEFETVYDSPLYKSMAENK